MRRALKHLKYPVRYPGIIPKAMNNYFRMLVLGQKRLRAVEFAVNYTCQCRCDHCSVEHLGQRGRPLMTTEEIRRTLAQLLDMGVMQVNFTGGESLLRDDLGDLVAAARPRSTVVSVATAGTLLNEKRADNLARWGVRIVTISLDSADPATHDQSRQHSGAFDKVMTATRLCKERDIDVFWCTILTDQNALDGGMMRLVDFAAANDVTLTINFSCPVGAWLDRPVGVTEELKLLHKNLMNHDHVRWEGHSNYFKEGCPAGIEKVYISPYGDVMPCPFIHTTFGSVLERPLRSIWDDMTAVEPFGHVQEGCPVADDPVFHVQYIEPLKAVAQHPIPMGQLEVVTQASVLRESA